MKKKLLKIIPLAALAVLLLPLAITFGQGGNTLTWDYDATGDGLCSAAKANSTPISGLTFMDTVAASGRWFYVARAVDSDGVESANSNELAVILPPSPPTNLRRN